MTKICATALFVLWACALAVKTLPQEQVAAAEIAAPAFDSAPPTPDAWLASAPTAAPKQLLASHSP